MGEHAYELDIPATLYREIKCPLGGVITFDGFQPHMSMVSNLPVKEDNLRIAFSCRYEFPDDRAFLENGLTNNYRLNVLKDDRYSTIELLEDGSSFKSNLFFV
jgi:hypothetical protein